jgi:hypothetical protein
MSSEMNSQSQGLKAIQLAAAKQLASHPNASAETLEKLSEQQPAAVLERVAEHAHTSQAVLVRLAQNPCAEVRSAVSENAHTPMATVQQLACDEHPDVRYRVAENANAPAVILDKLTRDENPFVVARARDTIKDGRSLLEQADELLMQEKFTEAEPLYCQLISGLEHLLGPNHVEVAQALHKLAASLIGQGKETAAAETEERANRIKSAIHEVC